LIIATEITRLADSERSISQPGDTIKLSLLEMNVLLRIRSSVQTYSVKGKALRGWHRSIYTLGIRRETKNKWERRVPLTPKHVEELITKSNIKVIVQPSTNRIFPDDQYSKAGAEISESLEASDVIVGIKEVPMEQLLPSKTYMFFSHTHKAQAYNMPMLQDILKKNIRLIDYELITNDSGKRAVLFGNFAGYSGMIDGIHVLGRRMLALGYGSPFLNVGMTHNYRSLKDAMNNLKEVGQFIKRDGIPKDFGPMTFVFTGNGNVSKGAQEVFRCLPHEFVQAEDLAYICNQADYDPKKVYGCIAGVKDYIRPNSGTSFFCRRRILLKPTKV